jgi:hypothetical protein
VIDLNTTDEPRPRRRSRLRIAIAAAAAVLLIAGVTTAYLVYQQRGTQVRFEVDSASGTALRVSWDIGITRFGLTEGNLPKGPFSTPWSTTVTADDYQGRATLTVMSTPTDEVTCRIIVEGEVLAEVTQARAVGCVVGWVPGPETSAD